MAKALTPRRQNAYAAECCLCHTVVPAGAGTLRGRVGGKWQISHLDGNCPTGTPAGLISADDACAECLAARGYIPRRDSSGILGLCCARCASGPDYTRSYC